MSKYTIELGLLIQNDYPLGLDKYPIFNENYRDNLNSKILNHFYFHEIGFETPDKFTFYLNNTMNEIMPYYNKLLESELISINPLLTFQRSNTHVKTSSSVRNEDLHNSDIKAVDSTATKTNSNSLNQTATKTNNTENTTTNTLSDILANDLSSTTTNALSSTLTNDLNDTTTNVGTEGVETENSLTKTSLNGNTNTKRDIFSDTPQALLTDSNVNDNFYATTTHIVNDSNTNSISDTISENKNDTKSNSSTQSTNKTGTTTTADTGTTTTDDTGTVTKSMSGSGTNNTDMLESETSEALGTINETNVLTDAETVTTTGANEINISVTESDTISENGFEISLSELVLKYR